ncbi:MAG: sigma 54-interacting transcriptional regulator [Polyangiaceae bacterium]
MSNTTVEKAPKIPLARAKLPVLRLVYSGDLVMLPAGRFTPGRGATPIGREAKGGIALPGDPRASRHHATLHAGPTGTLRVVDEKSRNGTFVNGERVDQRLLADGDVLGIGDSYFVVREEPEGLGDAKVDGLLGDAPSMRALRSTMMRLAKADATVLVIAESGCGKELVARGIHEAARPGKPIVAVNCSAIPESLAESQLFGHLAGAFSGAVARPGLFRAAEGGTLFLDEVGELPQAIQPKLLRVLQDRLVLPVGATTPVACDVRIVAATNRDLRGAVDEQRFRGDLYARLAQHQLTIAPVRERREDILLLLMHAMEAAEPGRPRAKLTPALAEALLLHRYPFNVREIQSLAAQLKLNGAGLESYDVDLVTDRLAVSGGGPSSDRPAEASANAAPEERKEAAEEREPPPDRARLEALLREHKGVVADVARAMGRSRKQVYRWVVQQGLDVSKFRG